MLAITVKQPYASLIVHGIKQWETRPAPPNGDMRPDGVRGLPGLAIDAGERIAIHAAAANTDHDPAIPLEAWNTLEEIIRGEIIRGAVIGTITVVDAYEICEETRCGTIPGRHPIVTKNDRHDSLNALTWRNTIEPTRYIDAGVSNRLASQLPFGDWTPGRWAWELSNPIIFDEPVPAVGKQGVWNWDGES